MIFRSPFELTRQECQFCRHALQAIRNDCAERLGRLTASIPAFLLDTDDMVAFIRVLQSIVDDEMPLKTPVREPTLIESLWDINVKVPRRCHVHEVGISTLRRPSRLIRLWPRLVIIPPITLILFRVIYGSRQTLGDQLIQAVETVSGFWKGYLLQPFREILDTVRTGGEEGVRIVSKEGVKADMEARSYLFPTISLRLTSS